MMPAVERTDLPLPLVARGKVRDVYAVGDERLLIVATDRISAFDVVLPQPIPDKGAVLTQLTAWWLARLGDITANHLISADPHAMVEAAPELASSKAAWGGRAMLVHRAKWCPLSAWSAATWRARPGASTAVHGTLAGEPLPPGLRESERLDPPVFSPATKAQAGHDENIAFSRMRAAVGADIADELKRRSLAVYERGRDIAETAGIILADTKFEFGTMADGRLVLIDEVMTPDSSRFWPQETYAAGRGQPSLDKQPVRDYLEELVAAGSWDKAPPPPLLPESVLDATADRYRTVFRRLTGFELEAFPTADPAAAPPAAGS
jgi:phosphoribosylaminoimidazole-succinocarboxamide synthase